MYRDFVTVDVARLIKEISKRWWLIVLSIILFSSAGYYFTQSMIEPVYRASSVVFVGKESGETSELSVGDIALGQRLTTDYQVLISSSLVTEEVVRALPSEFRDVNISRNLSVEIIGESRFMSIVFEDSNPERAMMVVNTITEVLKEKAEQIVGIENLQVVDYAQLPRTPVRPILRSNVAIGGFLGFLLATVYLLLKVMFNNTIRNQEDIETQLGLPVLGVIPKFAQETKTKTHLPTARIMVKLKASINRSKEIISNKLKGDDFK